MGISLGPGVLRPEHYCCDCSLVVTDVTGERSNTVCLLSELNTGMGKNLGSRSGVGPWYHNLCTRVPQFHYL